MTEKEHALLNQKFYEFLVKEGPQKEGECTLYEADSDEFDKFFLVTGTTTGNGTRMFIINGHFWYDYTEVYFENPTWKPIYRKVK